MRRLSIAIFLVGCGLMLSACHNGATSDSKAEAPPPSTNSQSSSPPASPDPKALTATPEQGPVIKDSVGQTVSKLGGPAQLVGTYTISEVHQNGVVTMIPHEIATQITFLPDGTFSRISKAQNKANFKDSGQFVIEGTDQLILKIVMSRGKIQQPPVEKRHKFSLSENGSELRMTAKDGKVGVFRR